MTDSINITKSIDLVIPPSGFLLDERVFVSLGILKVAAVLEKAGHQVRVLDLSGIQNYLEAMEDFLKLPPSDIIGLTATTPQFPYVCKIVERIRQLAPDRKVMLGGPHATLTFAADRLEKKQNRQGRGYQELQNILKTFDTVCVGDGELAIMEALKDDSPKLIDGDSRKGQFFMSNDAYAQTPMPARHLVDMDSYNYAIEGHKATSLIAQLGCPFHCGFCGGRNAHSLRVIRTRPNQVIVDEIEMLHKTYGYTGFMFYDDELNVNTSMVDLMERLIALQERLGVSFRLRGFIKAELFTERQAEVMYQAGFRWLLCGFEAADPRILVNIEKRATLEDNTRVVEIAAKYGLNVKALMSIGHPGERPESVEAIENWLVETGVDDFDCTVIATYPGTPYYDLALPHPDKKGVWTYTQPRTKDRLHAVEIDYATTADYYKGIPGENYQAFVFTDYLTSKELVDMRDELENSVRKRLSIPFNPSRAALLYEHSMGQQIPEFILRKTSSPQLAAS